MDEVNALRISVHTHCIVLVRTITVVNTLRFHFAIATVRWLSFLILSELQRWRPEASSKIQEVTLMRPFHGNL